MKILGWVIFILAMLSILINLFSKKEPLERFTTFLFQIPIIIYIGYSLFYLQ